MNNYKYLKEIKEFLKGGVVFDDFTSRYLWANTSDGGVQMITELSKIKDNDESLGQVRGYGAIQYLFDDIESANEFQDELGRFIAESINDKLKTI